MEEIALAALPAEADDDLGDETAYARRSTSSSEEISTENDLQDAFKQFASTEKMRLQERRRNQAKQVKDLKTDDLRKFSQNFKLVTPVSQDLVPILAKDKSKQEEIIQQSRRNLTELTTLAADAIDEQKYDCPFDS